MRRVPTGYTLMSWTAASCRISRGPVVVEPVRRRTQKSVNVHLMIVEPERYRHLCPGQRRPSSRACRGLRDDPSSLCALANLRSRKEGWRSTWPGEPIELIEYVLHLCKIVFIMTVNPGFGGQQFLPEMLPKIRSLRMLCEARGLDPIIEVDGGENHSSARQAIAAGATASRRVGDLWIE
jgi:ribulose-phosphate 3-epimerase